MKTITIAGKKIKRPVLIAAGGGLMLVAMLMILTSGDDAPPAPIAPEIPEVVEEQQVNILVAASDIKKGEIPDPSKVQWVPIYQSEVGIGDITDQISANAQDRVTKMQAGRQILSGERISYKNFNAVLGSALASKLKQGHRAYTFQVNATNSVGGYVTPGDSIDLFYRIDLPAGANGLPDRRIINLAQNVKVLATDALWEEFEQNQNFGVRTLLTVEVSVEQAGMLAAIGSSNSLYVVLRHPLDKRTINENIVGDVGLVVSDALGLNDGLDKSSSVTVITAGNKQAYKCTDGCVISASGLDNAFPRNSDDLSRSPTAATRGGSPSNSETSDDAILGLKTRR